MGGGKVATPQGLGDPPVRAGTVPAPSPTPAPGAFRPPPPVPSLPGPLRGPLPPAPPDPYEKASTRGNQATLIFDPDRSARVDRCDRIVFAQTCQILLDGVAVLPGTFFPDWKYRDAWALPSGVFVDLEETDTGPYYPHLSGGWRKDYSSDPATMWDSPHVERDGIFFEAGRVPKGAKLVVFRLESFAACVRGRDIGSWYEGVRWDWTKSAEEQRTGKDGTAVLRDRNVAAPSKEFLDAFAKYQRVKANATGR